MTTLQVTRTTLATAAVAWLATTPTFAQSTMQPREPLPEGRRIGARDGDLIVVDHDARIGVVRRRPASIRLIFNPSERWAVLLADFIPPGGEADGYVDHTYNWRQLEGTWPLGERWEGSAILEDYSTPGSGPNSFAIVLPQGRIQFVSGGPVETLFADPQALALLRHRSGGSGMVGRLAFEQAEQIAIRNAVKNAGSSTSSTFETGGVPGGISVTSSLTATASSSQAAASKPSDPNAPVRVGSVIVTPQKVHDVAPVYPESMRPSGVTGTVILELTIDKDGTVRSAKLLRGNAAAIDQAALEAARQWRYEPVLLNGAPVPVILTATVIVKP